MLTTAAQALPGLRPHHDRPSRQGVRHRPAAACVDATVAIIETFDKVQTLKHELLALHNETDKEVQKVPVPIRHTTKQVRTLADKKKQRWSKTLTGS